VEDGAPNPDRRIGGHQIAFATMNTTRTMMAAKNAPPGEEALGEDATMSRDDAADPGLEQFERFLHEWSRRDFLRRMGGAAALTAFSGGIVGLLEACGPGNNTTSQTPVKGGTVVEGWSTEPSYLLPVRSSDVYSNIANRLMFEGLLYRDNKGNMLPNFAKDAPVQSADGLTYTFKLRSDIKWSDGSPVTPDDVVFSYALYYDPKFDGLLGNSRPTGKRYLKSVTANGDTIVIQATTAYAPFLLTFGDVPIVPKKYLDGKTPVELNTDSFNSAPPVSNGKFKFTSWQKGDKLTLSRNDLYFRGPIYLDSWVYKKVSDSVAVLSQLKTGEVDAGRLDPATYEEAKAQSNLNIISFPTFSWDEAIFQLDPNKPAGKILADKSVRQALYYGLDRAAIVQASYFGQGVVADSVYVPISWAYNKDVTPKYTHDTNKAASLLDAAGWTKGSSGIREKGGQQLSIEMVTNADNTVRTKNLQIMQEQWRKIGVDAKIKTLATLGNLSNELTSARNFGVMYIGFSLSPDPDQSGLWHSRQTAVGGNNGGLYKNAQVDKILDDAVATVDKEKRKALYFQLQGILNDDPPSIIVCDVNGIYAVNKRVHNWNLNAFWIYGNGFSYYYKDVWVEPKK
jgi:peptide/nickel transport system substrate-binding protein